jgi:hypothetical protein
MSFAGLKPVRDVALPFFGNLLWLGSPGWLNVNPAVPVSGGRILKKKIP